MPGQQLVIEDLVCINCNDVLTDGNRHDEHLRVCESCHDDMTGYCDFCGFHYMVNWNDLPLADDFGVEPDHNMVYTEGENICTGCVHECVECGQLWAYESSLWECCPGQEEDDDRGERMHGYTFRPSLKFWDSNHGAITYSRRAKPGVLYMGLEIEVEKCANLVREMVEVDDQENWYSPNFYYWKHDGSLSHDGSEMVTMPATLQGHVDRFPFNYLDRLHSMGARAWAYPSCGMHIHVSRSAFTATHMWKFIKFQLNNADKLVSIAGRDSLQWASWNNDTMEDAKRQTKKYTDTSWRHTDTYPNRYSALNFNNMDTVELRYFRSNISRHGIMRNIELVHAMWAYTNQLWISNLIAHGWSFDKFVEFVQDKPEYATIAEYMNREGIA